MEKIRDSKKNISLFFCFLVLDKMSEQINSQELLNRICIMIVSIESLYEEMSQINMSRFEWEDFLNWYEEAMNFLRE